MPCVGSLRAMLRGLGLPRLLDASAATGGRGASAEPIDEEVRRRRVLLRDPRPSAAWSLALPRSLDLSAAAGGRGASAEPTGEEGSRRRALLRDQRPAAAWALGLPRPLAVAATAGGRGASAEPIGEEVRRHRALLRAPITNAFVVKPLLQGSPCCLHSSKVPLLGMVGVAGRRDYSGVAAKEAGKKVDATLRAMGFFPRGPISRIFTVVFLFGGVSLGVRSTVQTAVALSELVKLLRRHFSSWSWEEACVCQFWEVASTAIVEDASGWA